METATVENDKSAAFTLAHLSARVTEGKVLAEDLVEIGKRKAQRVIRKGREAGGPTRRKVPTGANQRGLLVLLIIFETRVADSLECLVA